MPHLSKSLIVPAVLMAVLATGAEAAKAKAKAKPAKTLPPITRTYVGEFPIAAAVTVPAGYSTVYVSGMVPSVLDPNAPKDSFAAYGNTEQQTETVLKRIEGALKAEGLGFGDVVNMKVLLVGDPAMGGKMDFAGMMKTYSKYFGTAEQPNKPTRITSQVAGLANPYYLVEIEVIAAKAPAK